MRYVRVVKTDDGGSGFIDVDVEQTETPYAENVPPMLVSQPLPAQAVVFVTTPTEMSALDPHPSPQRQFVIALEGEYEIETTDGERRMFRPGSVALVEDTEGRGHVTRISSGPVTFAAVPVTD
jgi:hypothetical protein